MSVKHSATYNASTLIRIVIRDFLDDVSCRNKTAVETMFAAEVNILNSIEVAILKHNVDLD